MSVGWSRDRLKDALERRQRDVVAWPEFRPAGVLVPILDAPDGPEILFTVRSQRLSNHAGQIAFPGGRCDDGETAVDAALRETHEEIGVRVAPVSVIGLLDDHPSPAKYVATPVVAVIPWPQSLTLNAREVDEVFTVPLRELEELEPRTEERTLREYRRTLHFYPWGDRLIWGLTGNVLKNLLDVLKHPVG